MQPWRDSGEGVHLHTLYIYVQPCWESNSQTLPSGGFAATCLVYRDYSGNRIIPEVK